MDPDDKMKALSDFSYPINRIAQSLKHGNMNQVGQDAWHLHMQYIVNRVTRFVNRLNHDYTGEGILINPTKFPNFLFPGLPPAINTCVYNNAFEISIGIVSSSLDREDLNDVHTSAIEDIQCTTDNNNNNNLFSFSCIMFTVNFLKVNLQFIFFFYHYVSAYFKTMLI